MNTTRKVSIVRKFRAIAAAVSTAALSLSLPAPANAQMVTGRDMPGFQQTFQLTPDRAAKGWEIKEVAVTTGDSEGANVLYPGQNGRFTFRVTNKTDQPIVASGKLEVFAYGTSVPVGDIWVPRVFPLAVGASKDGRAGSIPFSVNVPAKGAANVTVTPPIPARFGGYALIADLGDQGRAFAATLVRVDRPDPGRVQYPSFALDLPWPFEISEAVTTLFERLGIKGCRMGAGFYPVDKPDFARRNREFEQNIAWAKKHNITAMLTVGEGGAAMPLGRPRPWLDAKGVLQDTKSDSAWFPALDPDFEKWSRYTAAKHGWPRGNVNAIELWNEPWEGISISGWGADLPRYREMYRAMGQGITTAREKDGVEVLIGGACSSSNTRDKLFPDGSDEFLPYLDFVSIHYQPLAADPALEPSWVNRKGKYGRVKVWDTESWVANSEDRVAGVIASMRAQGQDRTAGVFGGNVFTPEIVSDSPRIGITQAWPPAAAVAATQKFIGQRGFDKLLFKGLPWVFQFAGRDGRADDGTLVVLGDLGAIYERNRTLYRGVTGLKNQAKIADVERRLAALPASATPEARKALTDELANAQVLDGATLTLGNGGGEFVLFDFYGNPVPAQSGIITVPLNGLGYFLRTTGKKGSVARLQAAVKNARIDGLAPVDIVAHDAMEVTPTSLNVRVTVTNVLNRLVTGDVSALAFDAFSGSTGQVLTLAPGETRQIKLSVPIDSYDLVNSAVPNNSYPVNIMFRGNKDGNATLTESLHVNRIARKSITVDGKLDEWAGVLPQPVSAAGASGTSLTEQAYLPFIDRKASDAKGTNGAVGYLAHDDKGFYFAARIADQTPYAGNIRFATRDDDQYYYPETSYVKGAIGGGFAARWTGQIVAPKTGTYRIATRADDGVRLWVGGKQIVDNWKDQGPTLDDGFVELTAGKPVDMRMEYYQGGGGAMAKLLWQPPGTNDLETIPASALAPKAGAAAGKGLTAEYFADKDFATLIVSRVDETVNFEWAAGATPDAKFGDAPLVALKWPDGVRRFSYRRDPDLPSGAGTDNVQIAFNVLPQEKKRWLPFPPGTLPHFMIYEDTDYEYALNQVAPEYGGGTEIFRLAAPGVPRKHFYPRQPKAPHDGGPVSSGKLVMNRERNTRLVECFLPWSEIPDVEAAMKAGRPIKFTFRVNDNDGPAYELAANRSVSKDNPRTFHNEWLTHWSNELEFAWEK